jgi:hypothetical protein
MAKTPIKKTFNVQDLIDQTNICLTHGSSNPEDIQRRHGMRELLEFVLHETGNYKGYRFLEQHEVHTGCLPGIHPKIYEGDVGNGRFLNTDPTRVKYS